MKRTILITGAAGYVGEMLCDTLARRDGIACVIALDKEPITDFLRDVPKLIYVQENVADAWQEHVRVHKPDTVIHAAWQIRPLYGNKAIQLEWNITGSDAVFTFAYREPSVQKVCFFSTAAIYSARRDNDDNHFFVESEGPRTDAYDYAREKAVAEKRLMHMHDGTRDTIILRPAAITGPRGRLQKIRFGLQSALGGQLRHGFFNKLVSLLVTRMPAPQRWVRQFIHEDDVVDAVATWVAREPMPQLEVYNLVPPHSHADAVRPPEMARITGKKLLPIAPWILRIAFALVWHLSLGRIKTAPHTWRFYSYPILLNGDKLQTWYVCRYSGTHAISHSKGRYAPRPETFPKL